MVLPLAGLGSLQNSPHRTHPQGHSLVFGNFKHYTSGENMAVILSVVCLRCVCWCGAVPLFLPVSFFFFCRTINGNVATQFALFFFLDYIRSLSAVDISRKKKTTKNYRERGNTHTRTLPVAACSLEGDAWLKCEGFF